jgi:hypothetical protein
LEEQSVFLRESSGAEPLDTRPRQTWGEVWTYHEQLVGLLVGLTNDEDAEIAYAAAKAVPRALYQGFIQGAAEGAVDAYGKMVSRALKDLRALPIAELRDSIELAIRALSKWREEQSRPEFDRWADTLSALLQSIRCSSDFDVRVRNLLGDWSYSEKEAENAIEALAGEGLRNQVLSAELMDWLFSPEAKKGHVFFWALGRADHKHLWLDRIQQSVYMARGGDAFVAYLGALAQTDPQFVGEVLDRLVQNVEVEGPVILRASLISGDTRTVRRICLLVENCRIDQSVIANYIASPWLKQVNADDLLVLLKLVAGANLNFALEAVRVLDAAVYAGHEMVGEMAQFAWACLQAARNLGLNDYFYCDNLAAKLAEANPEAGFEAFHNLIRRSIIEKSWNPIKPYSGSSQLWRVLTKVHRTRAVMDLLSGIAEREEQYWLTQGAREFVDLVVDRQLVLRFAEKGEREALAVAKILSASDAGFWDLALAILEKSPTKERIRSLLSRGAQRLGEAGVGLSNAGIALAQIEIQLQGKLTPTGRAWLEDLAAGLSEHLKKIEAFELEQKVNR